MMPNFLIIGAAKSGTTSLYHYLKQHHQVYVSPIKETEFFAFEGDEVEFLGSGFKQSPSITYIEDYLSLFEGVKNETAIGEASPVYLYNTKAIERIEHYIPDVKLIAILRNPVNRAYSQFLHNIRDGHEPIAEFDKALGAEESRIENNWLWGYHYIRAGFYYNQLEPYFKRFRRRQLRVYLYEDLRSRPLHLLRDLLGFLEVDDSFKPDVSMKHNVSGLPKSRFLHRFLTKPNWVKDRLKVVLPKDMRKRIKHKIRNRNLLKIQMPETIRCHLIQMYRDDISKLQGLIQRDLSQWLE